MGRLNGRACVDERPGSWPPWPTPSSLISLCASSATHCPGQTAQAARHLVSLIEGLRWPVLFGIYTEQQAMDILDAQLDLIFGPAR